MPELLKRHYPELDLGSVKREALFPTVVAPARTGKWKYVAFMETKTGSGSKRMTSAAARR